MPAPQAPTQLEQTSAVLGEYMLKGWTLTDLHCDTCRITPLMREPAGQAAAESRDPIQFCALCDRQPSAPTPGAMNAPTTIPAGSSSRTTIAAHSNPDRLPSPIPESAAVPSSHDDAANKISSLLLQGYSLLGTNCPKPACRGIPLVGFPRGKDGKKDSRRLCVGCGSRWIDEGDAKGLKLIGQDSVTGEDKGKARAQDVGSESPRTRRRNELYGLTKSSGVPDEDLAVLSEPVESTVQPHTHQSSSPSSSRHPTFEKASASLALTLDRLATSLEQHTAGTDKEDEARYFVDVKLHTDAMKDVLQVMGMMKGLEQ